MEIRADRFAYWYLRLNGFLTTVNFVVHPELGNAQRTDVDVLAVRFPHRAELMLNPMQDDPRVQLSSERPVVLVVEVKVGLCSLNGPWVNQAGENMQRVLRAIGITPIESEAPIAHDLYRSGRSVQPQALFSLACFGERANEQIEARWPAIPQITWLDAARFIFDRFTSYSRQKVSHPQWDEDGLHLWHTVFRCRDAHEFRAAIHVAA
jgi:hypothetical protein